MIMKKQYMYPKVDVRELNTSELMHASGTSPGLPPGPGMGTAPERRTEVF